MAKVCRITISSHKTYLYEWNPEKKELKLKEIEGE